MSFSDVARPFSALIPLESSLLRKTLTLITFSVDEVLETSWYLTAFPDALLNRVSPVTLNVRASTVSEKVKLIIEVFRSTS